ncbi:MAG: hypothetical protein VB912_02365, partial [Pirellulaceae bacterium]
MRVSLSCGLLLGLILATLGGCSATTTPTDQNSPAAADKSKPTATDSSDTSSPTKQVPAKPAETKPAETKP